MALNNCNAHNLYVLPIPFILAAPDDDLDIEPTTLSLLTTDFEIGQYIKDNVIPRAVLFFTGEESHFSSLDDDDYDFDGGYCSHREIGTYVCNIACLLQF